MKTPLLALAAILCVTAPAAKAINAFDMNMSQRNSTNTLNNAVNPPGTALGVLGFGSDQICKTWTASQVVANAGLTSLSGYGILDGVSTGGTYADPSWLTSLAWSKLAGTPTTLSGYGITDGVSTSASYSDPGWLAALAYSKLTGAPSLGTASAQNVAFFLQASNNLSDLGNATTARTNLGLGTSSTQNSSTFLQVSNNLNDLGSAPTARSNLGLGSAATQASTAFDASGAASTAQAASLQKSSNLSDLSSASTARTNLGLGTAATQASTAFDNAGAASAVQAASLQKTSNLSDLGSAATARTNLGLGTAATQASSAFEVPLSFTAPLSRSGNAISYSGPALDQRATVTTNSSGDYVWTFPVAFPTGVTPNVTITCLNSSTSVVLFATYNSLTNTGVTIHTSSLGVVALLLTLTQNTAATVSVRACSP